MSAQTIAASVFNAYPTNIQESLIKQGFVVVDDKPEAAPVAPAADTAASAPAMPNLLVEDDDEAEDEEAKSGLFVNLYVVHNGKRYRLTYASLDSDFVKFTDKDHKNRNGIRDAIVGAVSSAGIEAAKQKITFEVELTQQGHSETIDLMA